MESNTDIKKQTLDREASLTIQAPSLSQLLQVGGAVLGALLLGLPLAGLIWRAIAVRGWATLPAAGVPEAITLSLFTTAISLIITFTLGTPLALALARRRFPLRRAVNLLVELPIVLPPAVAGLALLVTFGRRGVIGAPLAEIGITLPFTVYAVVLAQTFVSMPFYVRAAIIGFEAIPRSLEDAARVDGADDKHLFLWITLPLAGRALLAGLMISWARALGEFGATLLFAGNLQGRTQTMPLLIYSVLEQDINAAIWTGVLLLVMAVTAISLSRWLVRSPS
jgi:molybdate transport system permease protein